VSLPLPLTAAQTQALTALAGATLICPAGEDAVAARSAQREDSPGWMRRAYVKATWLTPVARGEAGQEPAAEPRSGTTPPAGHHDRRLTNAPPRLAFQCQCLVGLLSHADAAISAEAATGN